MTSEAEAFITPLTLASLSGKAVHRSMLDQESDAWTMPHIRLAQNTDRILIAPATANVIGKLAHGLADDLLTTTLISATAPIWIAPAMNDEMYKNRIVQENCSRLKAMGIQFIEPVEGKLACGTSGVGHLADIQTIVDAVCA
jgi:phosphopantothenoylcysteine decarboxylase/phosphopantothenate--cysteine ligase